MDDDELPLPDFGAPELGERDLPASPPAAASPAPSARSAPSAPPGALALDDASAGPLYAVRVLGFGGDPAAAVEALERALGLDAITAEAVFQNLPSVVRRHATREVAMALEATLREAGGDVQLQPEGGEVGGAGADPRARARQAIAGTHEERARAAAAAAGLDPARIPAGLGVGPRASGPAPAPGPARGPAPGPSAFGAPSGPGSSAPRSTTPEAPHPGFWPRFGWAFLVPFLGGGVLWVGGLAIAMAIAFMVLAAPCLGLLLAPIAFGGYLGLLGTFFTQAAQNGLHDEEGAAPRVRWALPDKSTTVGHGVVLGVVALVLFGLPGFVAHRGAPHWAAVLVGLVPYAYWPMALTALGLTGRFTALVDLTLLWKGFRAGGWAYLAVVAVGWVSLGGLALAGGLLAAVFGPLGALVWLIAMAASFGYVAGVQGYLMGLLVADRLEGFEALHS